MGTKDSGRNGKGRIRDIEDVTPTRVPGENIAPLERVAPETDDVPRVEARKTPWIAWCLALIVLGGVAFGVTWFVTRDEGPGPVTSDEDSAGSTHDAAKVEPDTASAETGSPKSDVHTGTNALGADASSVDGGSAPDASSVDGGSAPDASSVDGGPAPDVAVLNQDATAVPDSGLVDAIPVATDVSGEGGADATPGVSIDVGASSDVAVQRDPVKARRLNTEGFAARKAGDHARARALYAEALTFNPDDPTARYNLACELALAGETREALAALTYLYKLGTPEARKLLAAARDDRDFSALRDLGQFMRLTR